jgi:hypothetical protein
MSMHAYRAPPFTYDLRPKQHSLLSGIFVQIRSIGDNTIVMGNEVSVDYGSDYCKFPIQGKTGLSAVRTRRRRMISGRSPNDNALH